MTLPEHDRTRRPRPRPRYWLRRLAVLSLLLAPVLIYLGWRWLNSGLLVTAHGAPPAPRVSRTEPVYVLVLGVDERPDKDDPGRSDTMILVRLSQETEAAHIISIPRDTVTFVKAERDRINSAYLIGGAELAASTVSDLLQVPVPYYVKVNLQGFEAIIDQLGGISLDVERDYYYHDPYQNLLIDLKKGPQVLTGKKALHYVRLRYDGAANDDLSRISRQQKFMQAVKSKLVTSPLKVPSLVSTMRRYITTNIPEQDQLTVANLLFGARDNLTILTLPGNVDDATGTWHFSRTQWKAMVEAWSL